MTVRGKNVVLLAFDTADGTWKGYACASSLTLTKVTDSIETSVSGTGKWATFLPTKNSFSGSCDGVVSFNEAGKLTIKELSAIQMAQKLLLLKFQYTDDEGSVYSEEGACFITSSSYVGNIDSMAVFTIDFKGSGQLTPVFEGGDFNEDFSADFLIG